MNVVSEKLNCCFCNKEVDINEKSIPPSWYGKFEGSHILVSVTCSECLNDPVNLRNWKAAK